MPELAGYRVDGVLGSGGMGVVYRAINTRNGATVALKVLGRAVCDEETRHRFEREASAAMALRHPNVVRVYDFGSDQEAGADGDLYLAMELLDGEGLDVRLERGPLTVEEIVRVGCAAAEGLGAAHAAGIVHRDVKPGNLFLCADGTVKILDFGLAVSIAEAPDTRVTAANAIVGTPSYMAVERVRGTRDEDPRADVWGLGATLYHALCGRTPFDAPTAMAELVRVVTSEPDPMPLGAPTWLQQVILKALEKEREARWQTMRELARALADGFDQASGTHRTSSFPEDTGVPLGDEVRIVSVLFAEGIESSVAFEAAVRAERGVASPLLGRRAVGVFGGESWQGDEAERAVRAGLRARASFAAAKLGVATGRGVRARAGDMAGAAVESARRALAAEGVGTDEETQRRIRGGFDVVDGRVTARRPGRVVFGVRGLGGADVPIFGRDGELALLSALLRQAIDESQAAGVLLLGPAGIGKSRLRHELLVRMEEMPEDVLYLEARGEAHRALQGWHAIANALRRYAELPEGTPSEDVQARLLALCPTRACAEFLGEILGADFPETPHLRTARSDPGIMRDQVVIAVGDLLESLSAAHPLLLGVEDLQWADALSLHLLEVLLRRLDRQPFFMLAASRSEPSSPLPDVRRMVLPGVSRQATRSIVRAVLGDDPATGPHAEAIHERTGGNPHFAEELALALRDGLKDLPTSIEGAVQARLDALPRQEKDLLRRASVLGRRFWTEALSSMGETEPVELLGRLHRRELVTPETRARLIGTNEWRFRQALVQEVSYESLTPEQRQSLHRAAGRWLAARTDAPAAEVARHFELGGASEAAATHWRAATDTASREGDALLTLEASAHALAAGTDGPTTLALRLLRADVLHHLGRAPEEALEIDKLVALVSAPSEKALVQELRVRHLRLRGRYGEALGAAVVALGQSPGRAGLLVEVAMIRAHSGRPAEGIAPAEAGLEAARATGDAAARGRAVEALGRCHALLGDVSAATPAFEEALAAYEEAGDPRRAATARGALAYTALAVGRHEEALPALEKACDLCRAAGNRLAEGYALHNLGLARARSGDFEGGFTAESAALAIAIETEERRLELGCRKYQALILFEASRPAEALAALEPALDVPEEIQGHLAPELRGLAAAILVALGRRDEARALAERALVLWEAAAGMEELEAELFLAAHEAGIEGALERGVAVLNARAEKISDPDRRATFLARIPAQARLLATFTEDTKTRS